MDLVVFGKSVKKFDENDFECLKDAIRSYIGGVYDEYNTIWQEAQITKNIVSMWVKTREPSALNPNKIDDRYYTFNLLDNNFMDGIFNNGLPENEIDWKCIRKTYEKYGAIQIQFIDAIDNKDLETAKKLNKEYPKLAYPSIQDSFYARWIVKTKSLDFLKWAKEVDENIDFSPNNNLENPLKIAIAYQSEEIALWLLDNYPVSPFDSRDKLMIIDLAHSFDMQNLVNRLLQNEEMVKYLRSVDETKYFPDEAQDIFLF